MNLKFMITASFHNRKPVVIVIMASNVSVSSIVYDLPVNSALDAFDELMDQ